MTIRLPASKRRQQLIQAALTVFAAEGYHSTTMDDIAAVAGITKPVLYQHFDSKRDLYVHLIADVGDRMTHACAGAAEEVEAPRDKVEAGFRAYFDFISEHTDAFRLLFDGGNAREVEVADAITSVEDSMASVVAPLIAVDIDPDHQRALAYGILGIAESIGRAWARGKITTEPRALAGEVAELAWSGLRGIQRH